MPKKHFKVGAGMAVNERGRILMGLRADNASRPSMWEMPGGKLEDGETLVQAIAREWREELGVTIEVNGGYIATARFSLEVDLEIELWGVRIVHGTPQPLVHSQVRWVDLAYAIGSLPCAPATYLHYPSAMEYLARIQAP